MAHKAEIDKFIQVQDAAVTNAMKWEIELLPHINNIIHYSTVPLQDVFEGIIFVSFAFALADMPFFTDVWLKKTVIVIMGLISTDLFAPAMANAMRLSLALIFYSDFAKK